jgi:hypothetical protein
MRVLLFWLVSIADVAVASDVLTVSASGFLAKRNNVTAVNTSTAEDDLYDLPDHGDVNQSVRQSGLELVDTTFDETALAALSHSDFQAAKSVTHLSPHRGHLFFKVPLFVKHGKFADHPFGYWSYHDGGRSLFFHSHGITSRILFKGKHGRHWQGGRFVSDHFNGWYSVGRLTHHCYDGHRHNKHGHREFFKLCICRAGSHHCSPGFHHSKVADVVVANDVSTVSARGIPANPNNVTTVNMSTTAAEDFYDLPEAAHGIVSADSGEVNRTVRQVGLEFVDTTFEETAMAALSRSDYEAAKSVTHFFPHHGHLFFKVPMFVVHGKFDDHPFGYWSHHDGGRALFFQSHGITSRILFNGRHGRRWQDGKFVSNHFNGWYSVGGLKRHCYEGHRHNEKTGHREFFKVCICRAGNHHCSP